MLRVVIAFVMVAISAASANADIEFVVSIFDEDLKLKNTGTQTAGIAAYEVYCFENCLNVQGWHSIFDQYREDSARVTAALGTGAAEFFEIVAMESTIFEGSLGRSIYLDPGEEFSLGNPFTIHPCEPGRYEFRFLDTNNQVREQKLRCIPEPSGLIFMGLGGLLLGLNRRRQGL